MPVFTDLTNSKNSGNIKQLMTIHLQLITQGKHELIWVNGIICDQFAKILIDGASTHNFISSRFIHRHQLQDQLIHDNGIIEMGDGSTNSSSDYGNFPYLIQNFHDKTIFYISKLSNRHDVILGKAWLYDHQPLVDW